MKAAMVGFEAIAVWALVQLLSSFGFAKQRVLIYAWHPLAVWEFAGSGHVDALAIAFIGLALLARSKHAETLTGVLIACGTCVKFFPAVLLPALYMRRSWKMPLAFIATVLIAYLPYLSVGPIRVLGSLPFYANERGMVSGDQFFLLTVARQFSNAHLPTSAYLVFVIAVLGILALWVMQDQEGGDTRILRNGLIIASVFMVLVAPHFSWYFCWLIVFLCFIPSIAVFYLTVASFLLYLTWREDETVEKISQSMERPLTLQERTKVKLHLWICAWCQWYMEHLQLIREASRAKAVDASDMMTSATLSNEARERIRRRLTNQN
jgi:hypothetical protein